MLRFENDLLTKVVFLGAIAFFALLLPINASDTSSTKLLLKARALLNEGQDDAALISLDTLISKEPNNAQAYSERSRALGMLEKYDEALEDSNKAIALDPRLAEAYANRAEFYTETEQYQKALGDSNKAIALNPKLAIAYLMRALVYERLGKYQEDIENCSKAIAIDRSCSRNYIHRAFAFRKLGQYQRALQDLNRALSLTSSKAGAYIDRGYTYLRIGKNHMAMEDFAMAAQISPRSYYDYSLRAEAYGELGQYQKQINDLTLVAKINPKVADVYAGRAYAYYQLFQLENAIGDCTTAMKLDPASTKAYYHAAAAYDEMGLYSKSMELRTKILGLKTGNAAFDWYYRGQDYERLGKFDLAQADWRKAIDLASPSQRDEMKRENPLVDFNTLPSGKKYQESMDKELKGNPLVLPFHYDQGIHIWVPLIVTGYSSEFMLDTGSSYTHICRQALLGVAVKNNIQMRDLKAPGKNYLNDFFTARALKLDTLILPNVTLSVREDLSRNKSPGGFLGGNILENFVVTVDYRKKRLILATTQKCKPSTRAIIVPMRIRGHVPHCSVKLDGKLSLWALLDTGSPFSMSADSLLKPILPEKLTFKEQITGPAVGDLRSESIQLNSLEVGLSKFKPPVFDVFPAAEAPNAASTIILGNDFLSGFGTVTFDYPARRIIFEPNETASESGPQLYCKGSFYLAHNEPQLALDAFTKTISLDKEFAPACYRGRVEAFEHLKQHQKAIQDLNALIEFAPKDAWIFYRRACNYRMLAKYRLQIADDSTAIYLQPKFKVAYLDRAWAFDKLGMHQLAEKDRSEATKLP